MVCGLCEPSDATAFFFMVKPHPYIRSSIRSISPAPPYSHLSVQGDISPPEKVEGLKGACMACRSVDMGERVMQYVLDLGNQWTVVLSGGKSRFPRFGE